MSMDEMDDQLPSKEFFKKFNLNGAWEDTKDEFKYGTAKTKATSAAKLLGKSIWNAGLHIAKNAPKHIAKANEANVKALAKREEVKESLNRKSNSDLISIVKSDNDDTDRRAAYDILKQRKAEHEAKNT